MSGGQSDKNVPKFQFIVPALFKSNKTVTNSSSVYNSPEVVKSNVCLVPEIPFGNQCQSTSGIKKFPDDQSSSVFPFGNQSSMKSSTWRAQNFRKILTPKFKAPKSDGNHSTSVIMQAGTPEADDTESTSAVQQFGASKVVSEQSTSTCGIGKFPDDRSSINISIENTDKSSYSTKPTEPVKFVFGSSWKYDSESSTEPTNVVSVSKNGNKFSFSTSNAWQDIVRSAPGNPAKNDVAVEESTQKLQFGNLPVPKFRTSNGDHRTLPHFITPVSRSVDEKEYKFDFSSQTVENKPTTTSVPDTNSADYITNAGFRFCSSGSKPKDDKSKKTMMKPYDAENSSFPSPSSKTSHSFVVPQNFGDKQGIRFINGQQKKEPKIPFTIPTFGSRSVTCPPFIFKGNYNPLFGYFPSSQLSQFNSMTSPNAASNNSTGKKSTKPLDDTRLNAFTLLPFHVD